MSRHPFRILNVFAESALAGNALAVFEEGTAISEAQMQALALQFNLSETIVRLHEPDAVRRCQPDPVLLARHGSNGKRVGLVYVWAHEGRPARRARGSCRRPVLLLEALLNRGRPGHRLGLREPGRLARVTRHELPISLSVAQGAHTGRPCKLLLDVDSSGGIFVTGNVIEVGRGEIVL
jgi:hypothetical protein